MLSSSVDRSDLDRTLRQLEQDNIDLSRQVKALQAQLAQAEQR